MDQEKLFTAIINKFPFVERLTNIFPEDALALRVPKEIFYEFARWLKEEPELNFDYLSFIAGTDYRDRIEVVYYLYSFGQRHKIFFKVNIPRDCPLLASVSGIWPTANWHEREAFDLLGIKFTGHPDLRRILLPEDWSEGPPLLKDFQHQPDKWD